MKAKLVEDTLNESIILANIIGGTIGLIIGSFILQNTLGLLNRRNFGYSGDSKQNKAAYDKEFEGNWLMDPLTTKIARKLEQWKYNRKFEAIMKKLIKNEEIQNIINDPEMYDAGDVRKIVDFLLTDEEKDWLTYKGKDIINNQLMANEDYKYPEYGTPDWWEEYGDDGSPEYKAWKGDVRLTAEPESNNIKLDPEIQARYEIPDWALRYDGNNAPEAGIFVEDHYEIGDTDEDFLGDTFVVIHKDHNGGIATKAHNLNK